MHPDLVDQLRRVPLDFTKPHEKDQRSLAVSAFRVTAKFVYLLGRHVIEKKPGATRTIVLRERGFFDYAVDTKRYGLDPRVGRYALLLGKLFPKSDLALLLSGDALEIHNRKPELEPDVIANLINGWGEVGPRSARTAVTIDTTSQDIDSSIDEAVRAIITALELEVPAAALGTPEAG